MVKLILWLFDAVAWLIRSLGADYSQFRAILENKLILDTRRRMMMTVHKRKKKPGNAFAGTLVFYGFMGVFIGMSALMVGALTAVTWATGSTWGWLTEISGNTKVINPLAAPSAVAGVISAIMAWIDDTVVFNSIVAVTRTVSSVIMVLGLVICWFVFRQNPRRNMAGMVAAYGVAVVFNAVALPWYYASLLTPIGTFRPPRWLVQGTVVATLILCMSFSGGGNNRFYDIPWMVAITLAAWFALHVLFVAVDETRSRNASPSSMIS
mgnify:CR=1 FL=1